MRPATRAFYAPLNRAYPQSDIKKRLLKKSDFIPYEFKDEVAYQAFWNWAKKSTFLYTDGTRVARVNAFKFIWEWIRGLFGSENRCKRTTVKLALSKVAYSGYIKGWKISTEALSPEHPMSVFSQPLNNDNTERAQETLIQRHLNVTPNSQSDLGAARNTFGSTIISREYLKLLDLNVDTDALAPLKEISAVLPFLSKIIPDDEVRTSDHRVDCLRGALDTQVDRIVQSGQLPQLLAWAIAAGHTQTELAHVILQYTERHFQEPPIMPGYQASAETKLPQLVGNNNSMIQRHYLCLI